MSAGQVVKGEPCLLEYAVERAAFDVSGVHRHYGRSPIWVAVGGMRALLPSKRKSMASEDGNNLPGGQHGQQWH